jgi:hypothetical protein
VGIRVGGRVGLIAGIFVGLEVDVKLGSDEGIAVIGSPVGVSGQYKTHVSVIASQFANGLQQLVA